MGRLVGNGGGEGKRKGSAFAVFRVLPQQTDGMPIVVGSINQLGRDVMMLQIRQ